MEDSFINKKRLIAALMLMVFTVSCMPGAFARDRHHHGHYRYHNGDWHRDSWFWFGIGATALTIGTVVNALPPRHDVIYVRGEPYYHCDNVYYRHHGGRYVVVERPVETTTIVVPVQTNSAPAQTTIAVAKDGDETIVNVPNSNGTFTPVKLIKHKKGYRGPQGEYYEGNPTVEQLRVLYAK